MSITQEIFNYLKTKPNQWVYYTEITRNVNESLINKNIKPKKGSTIERAVRMLSQKSKKQNLYLPSKGFKTKVIVESDKQGNFMLIQP